MGMQDLDLYMSLYINGKLAGQICVLLHSCQPHQEANRIETHVCVYCLRTLSSVLHLCCL